MTYPRNQSGDEYYATNKYIKLANGNEIYAKKRNGDEFYLNDSKTKKDVLALRIIANKPQPYFALTKDGIPICPIVEDYMKYLKLQINYYKNENGKELYPKLGNNEMYIGFGDIQKYAKNENNDEYYAIRRNKMYYAFKKDKNGDDIEYFAHDHKGNVIMIDTGITIIYPINLKTKNPIYPVSGNGDEKYLVKNNKEIYGTNNLFLPVYAKKKSGDNFFAKDQNESYYASFLKNNKMHEYYPKLSNKKEFYLEKGDKLLYAKHFLTNEYYAKDEIQNEILALNKGLEYYVTNINEDECYPITSTNNEFYRVEGNIEKVAFNKKTKIGYYAKNSKQTEFYPKNFNDIPDILIEEELEVSNEPTDDQIQTHMAG